jgi:hypothetical protein
MKWTLSAVLLFTLNAHAANYYWVGLLPGSWNSILNWAASSGGIPGAGIPGAADVAIFDGGLLGADVGNCTLAASVTVTGLTMTSGYTGAINVGANTLTVTGNVVYDGGSFSPASGSVTMAGIGSQTITSSGTSFYNLVINNSGSGVQLVGGASVLNTLTMTNGNINLNGNNLTLGSSASNPGTLNWTSGTMINTGTFTRWIGTSTGTTLFPLGTAANPRFFTVNETTAPTTGGTITVAYTDASTNSTVSISDPPSTIVVRKDLNWAVTTGNGLAGGTYGLDVQGTGFGTINSVSDLRICLAASVVGNAGVNAGTTTDPQINRTGLSLANLQNTFYIGSINDLLSPLPLGIETFTATLEKGQVFLDWTTALPDSAAVVERSTNGITWDNLIEVTGKLSAVDPSPLPGTSFYRLEQAGMYSGVVPVDNSIKLQISPNPATDLLTVTFPATGQYTLILYSASGRVMMPEQNGKATFSQLKVSGLNRGVYFLKIVYQGTQTTEKVLID